MTSGKMHKDQRTEDCERLQDQFFVGDINEAEFRAKMESLGFYPYEIDGHVAEFQP